MQIRIVQFGSRNPFAVVAILALLLAVLALLLTAGLALAAGGAAVGAIGYAVRRLLGGRSAHASGALPQGRRAVIELGEEVFPPHGSRALPPPDERGGPDEPADPRAP
jgi:hypothetical protein